MCQDREDSKSSLRGDRLRTERQILNKHRVNIIRQREFKTQEKDEYATYGDLVAMKLKKISSSYARSTAQYHINNILYKAEIGEYDKPRPSQNFSLNNHFRAESSSVHHDSHYDVHSQRSSSPTKSIEYNTLSLHTLNNNCLKYEEIEVIDDK